MLLYMNDILWHGNGTTSLTEPYIFFKLQRGEGTGRGEIGFWQLPPPVIITMKTDKYINDYIND